MVEQPIPPVWNEITSDVTGTVIQAGSIHSLTVSAGVPVRSYYREQVRRIAPPDLLDRDEELADLAEFCAGDGRPYRWLRAAAWSGKSALLSWFVLHPPPGVRVVSFFITARLPGQNDRAAFVDNVLEQLLALLGRPVPPFLTDTTREAHLLGLLGEAADACRSRGERLVLVVDGLDEDRGVVAGPGAHSIAALLPADPPAGTRIVVAGRPNPPVPDDVPDDHPLRDPATVRTLAVSAHARVRQYELTQDLHDLLAGGPPERDLVGFLVAGGGMSAADLCELTGRPAHRMTAWLGTVRGRVFDSRETRWSRVSGLLLGHEELHRAAETELGSDRIAGYRDRLHDWAGQYRDRRWPEETPDYLLDGYVTMLAGAGDLDRAVDCVTDTARHDRMLARFGTDAAALAEIDTVQRRLAEPADPDLAALGRVVVHHDHLLDRNSQLPAELLPVWASLGDFTRVENLAAVLTNNARGYSNPHDNIHAAIELATAAGERDCALRLVNKAEQLARGITSWGPEMGTVSDPWAQSWALARVIGHMEVLGQPGRADAVAATLFTVQSRVMTLTGRARAALADADPERARRLTDEAEALARTMPFGDSPGRDQQTLAWQSVAELMAAVGDLDRAVGFVHNIPGQNAMVVTGMAETLAALGAPERALQLTVDAEALIRGFRASDRVEILARLAVVADRVGDADRSRRLINEAESHARDVSDPMNQVPGLLTVGRAAIDIGDGDRARRLVVDAEALAKTIDHSYYRSRAMATVAEFAMAVGDHAGAETIANAITEPGGRAWALARLALSSVNRGDRAAWRGAADVNASAISGTGPRLTQPPYVLVPTLTDLGEHEIAHRLTRTMPSPTGRVGALVTVASAMVAAGDRDRARTVIAEAEGGIGTLRPPHDPAYALAGLAKGMAAVGKHALAARLVDWTGWAEDLMATTGKDLAARQLAAMWAGLADTDRVELLARRFGDRDSGAGMLIDAVSAATAGGHHEVAGRLAKRAETAIRAVYPRANQPGKLCHLATALVTAEPISELDPHPRVRIGPATEQNKVFARRIVEDVLTMLDTAADSGPGGWLAAVALAALGEFDRARALATTLPDGRAGVRIELLGELARLAVEAGELGHARRMTADAVSSVDEYMWSTGTVRALVRALLVTGQEDEAERFTARITDEIWRVRALADRIEDAVARGQSTRIERPLLEATRIINGLADPLTRSEELAGLLRHLKNGADRYRGTDGFLATVALRTRRLLAQALVGVAWEASLPAMAFAAPEAVTAIANEILALPTEVSAPRSRE